MGYTHHNHDDIQQRRRTAGPTTARRWARGRRRGVTAILAMLYLGLFSTLALGFFAAVSTSTKLAGNDRSSVNARLAAESGMQFMRYHLGHLDLPATTTPATLMQQTFNRLAERLDGYAGPMDKPDGQTVYAVAWADANQDRILVPSAGYLGVGGDAGAFRAELWQVGERLRVKVEGRYGMTRAGGRAIQLDYAVAQNAAKIFDFGVASRSAVSMNGNVSIRGTTGNDHMGSVLSTTLTASFPLVMTGPSEISGDVSILNPVGKLSIGAQSTVAGYKVSNPEFKNHVHKVDEAPDFPVVDTTEFLRFVPPATATSGPGVITSDNATWAGNHKNIRIKAGANPTFDGGALLQGVIVVEQPNRITFAGGTTIQGVIVSEVSHEQHELMSNSQVEDNEIRFAGGVTAMGIETLPASDFSPELRALTGSMMLVPGFSTVFTGNFGTVGGSLIASKITFNGTPQGTVKGSVINLKDTAVQLTGTADIIIESQGTSNYPAGVYFDSHYAPLADTYQEVPL